MSDGEVISAFGGADPRCDTLFVALLALIYERGSGLPLPSVVGVLRLIEHKIVRDHRE